MCVNYTQIPLIELFDKLRMNINDLDKIPVWLIKLLFINKEENLNYVNDICNGFITLTQCDVAVGKEINIGSGTEISIGDLANLLIELIGSNAKIVSQDARKRPEESEVGRLVCDNSLMKELTGWKPETPLKEGLLKTIEWFRDKENLQRYKSDVYNI